MVQSAEVSPMQLKIVVLEQLTFTDEKMKLFPCSNEAWINGQLKGAATACPYKGSDLWEVDPLSK